VYFDTNKEGFYTGTLYGYTMKNYDSFVTRAFLATREKHESFPDCDSKALMELLSRINLFNKVCYFLHDFVLFLFLFLVVF
jgi:hypothetical protein